MPKAAAPCLEARDQCPACQDSGGSAARRPEIGGRYGASSRGQLRVDRFFLPEELRRTRLGSRLLKMAEEEGRQRGCTRVTLNTMKIQAPGFYLKQGDEMAATLDCDPPGVTRYVMTKRLL